MRKLSFVMCVFMALNNSCANQPKKNNPVPGFKSFEISYTDGWIKHFSYLVDSSKTYLAQTSWGLAYSGTLPDTIFALIDSTYRKILSDTTIKSNGSSCCDCTVVAIQIVTKNDTIRIYQQGAISKELRQVIKSLQAFLDNGSHQRVKTKLFLDTYNLIFPMPPIRSIY